MRSLIRLVLQLSIDLIFPIPAFGRPNRLLSIKPVVVDLLVSDTGYTCDSELIRQSGTSGEVKTGEDAIEGEACQSSDG